MTAAEPKLGILFGCLAEPIKKQLNDQGFTLESKDEEYFQKVADAINFLKFGYITGSIVQSAQKKLMKKIVAAAKPIKNKGGN